MAFSRAFIILCFSWFLLISGSQQLQSSQTQVLRQLRKQLEYPKPLDIWNNSRDLCNTPPSPELNITCFGNSVTELRIIGDKPVTVRTFYGYPIPGQTLSRDFSIDSFVTTLSRLTSLKVVSLVSLGLWGPLPDKIHRLRSLEILDLSWNFLYGLVPPKISTMVKLQTLTLDENFFNSTTPDWFDSLSNLTVLSLKTNQLDGPFPPSIIRITTLTYLSLSQNHLSGKLPDLSSLSSLEVLDLRENQLDSELPKMPKGLVTVLLSKNSFSGEIPKQYGELGQLQHLDLSFNDLRRTPPASLFSLPNISYLNLASNQLSGSLPNSLSCSSELGFVDISTNRFMGGLPSCLSSRSDKRVVKFNGNCLSVDPLHQHNDSFCKEIDVKRKESSGKGVGVLFGVIGGIAIIVILLLLAFLALCRKYCPQGISEQRLLPKELPDNTPIGFSSELLANARYISQAAKIGSQNSPAYRLFSLEELQEATNNFDQSRFMGDGSIGKLYKGRLENGSYIAIRCLALFKRDSIRNLKLRLDLLSKLRHPHLVCLLGHCIDGAHNDSSVNRVFLIYEYVPNGNLHSHLSEHSPEKVLKWSERLAILIGVAKAVHFLHMGVIPGFFYNRLKSNNILLDEHRIGKLSDYGLSIITEEIEKREGRAQDHKSPFAESKPQAWQMTKLQDDVYSFGFILLETLVGAVISERREAYWLNEMAASLSGHDGRKRVIDPIVLATSARESLSIVISITNKCISPESSTRPSIEDVLWNLQYAAQVQATADSDQRSDVASQA
ncbi:probable inactive leucine-rich repeat receptor-like protein kinase At3g03770 [Magnolia sinica]|uniref:probable inactive leucine-rich repeat receptor-like protein kinase At3g03770 n=1 Tax=Magnolia sinica TaxID=86752 RepID=UPI002658A8A8|nr:probable inactive leucine-rich repeat receptor-like protein kinase At3g03770 [Magnolia sinica]